MLIPGDPVFAHIPSIAVLPMWLISAAHDRIFEIFSASSLYSRFHSGSGSVRWIGNSCQSSESDISESFLLISVL